MSTHSFAPLCLVRPLDGLPGWSGTGFRFLASGVGRASSFAPLVGLCAKLGFPVEVFDRWCGPSSVGTRNSCNPCRRRIPLGGAKGACAFIKRLKWHCLPDYRRGQILPRSAAPEVIGEHMHRWTYGVLIAGLLGDAGKTGGRTRPPPGVDGCEGLGSAGRLDGNLRDSQLPVMESDASLEAAARLGGVASQLMNRLAPPPVLAWLAADAALMSELKARLSGRCARSGAIGDLVCRARRYDGGPKDIEVRVPANASPRSEIPGSAPRSWS